MRKNYRSQFLELKIIKNDYSDRAAAAETEKQTFEVSAETLRDAGAFLQNNEIAQMVKLKKNIFRNLFFCFQEVSEILQQLRENQIMQKQLDKKTRLFIKDTSNLLELRKNDVEEFQKSFENYKIEYSGENWIPLFLTEDTENDLGKQGDLLFWEDLKKVYDEDAKNRKLITSAVKRAQLSTLKENRAKFLQKSDHEGFKSYYDFQKRQTLMSYNWANADDLHLIWKKLPFSEKGNRTTFNMLRDRLK